MDFVNQAYAQLYGLYRSMTPGSRLMAGLLAVVVLLGMGYLLTHEISTPDVDLMHGVPVAADQWPRMEAAFAKANLTGYEIRGTSIRVPRGQEAAYMAALAEGKALPPNFGAALADAISVSNPFEGRQQREERLKIALQAELSLIIRSMAGIESAYVLYDVDNKVGFNKDKLITATACVKPAGAAQLDERRVEAIRYLVAGVIAGLKPENVTVSDLSGRTWHGNVEDASSAEENAYVSLQRTYEQDLKAKILNALCFIPNVTVAISVVLDRERITRIKQERQSPRPERRGNSHGGDSHAKDRRSGHSGASAQQLNTGAILNNLLGGSRADDDSSEPDDEEPVSRIRVEKESLGLTPVSATVSVGVPISYFQNVWRLRNSGASHRGLTAADQAAIDAIRIEETAKIQRHVAQLLPSGGGAAKAAELVAVTTFQDIPAEQPPVPGFGADALAWLRQSWATLGMIAARLAGLLVLRSVIRAASAAGGGPSTLPNDNRNESSSEGGSAVVPPPHARGFHNPAPSPRDEVSELVEADPDTAAGILRTWIGQVG